LNLRLHPYQVSRAKRGADQRFPRSRASVRGEGMRSNSPTSAPSRGRHALSRLLLIRFAPLDLGCQGQRATSEVATRDNLARPGRPHGQGLGTADEVGAHRDGVGKDRSDRGCLCWHTVELQALVGGSAAGAASTAPMPGLQATWPVRIALRWPLTNPARVDWSSKPIGPIAHSFRGSSGVKSRGRHIANGEHPLVHALVAGNHPLG
jgi:hypothetical protein